MEAPCAKHRQAVVNCRVNQRQRRARNGEIDVNFTDWGRMIGRLPRLQLLGGFRLTDGAGNEIAVSSRKGRALLAVVALTPGLTTTRARLRTLLWSDRGEDQASASLRQLLVVLRRELAPTASVMRVSSAFRSAICICASCCLMSWATPIRNAHLLLPTPYHKPSQTKLRSVNPPNISPQIRATRVPRG